MQKVFEIGNSVAVTIPKKAGIKLGTKLKFRLEKDKLIYTILDSKSKKLSDVDSYINKTSGSLVLKDASGLAKVLNELEETQYDN